MSPRSVALAEIAADKGLIGGLFGSSLVQKDYSSSGVPVIRGTNLSYGPYIGGEFVFVTNDKVRRDLARNTAVPGDLIFTQRGTLGQVALVPDGPFDQYVVSQSQMRLRLNPDIANPKFVYYACSTNTFVKQVDDHAISTGVPHINLGILSKLEIPLPDFHKQTAIAEILGALDDKIAANSKLAASSTDLAVSLLQGVQPSIHLGAVVSHRKNSVAPENLSSDFVAHYSLPAFDMGGAPDHVNPSEIKSNKFSISRPSVLISKLNPRFPRVWDVASLPVIPALASTEFLVLEPVHSSTSVLWATLCQPAFGQALEAKVAGTSGSHQRVKPTDLLATPVIDPRQLSEGIQEVVQSLGAVVSTAREENIELAAMRDQLLPELVSGKVPTEDAETLVEAAI